MKYLVSLAMLVWFVPFAFANDVPSAGDGKKVKCPVCGMFVAPYADWNAAIVFSDSTTAVFDGSKDMFKYYLDRKKYAAGKDRASITAVTVKDYYSKEETDARKAWYVIWGDIYGPMGHEPIPFETEENAKKFMSEHHGRKVLRFQDITLKLLHSLDNPE
ncbi:MAG: nitrous oxide reductase accessory protein NosL [Nitrospirota bacterium]